MPEAGGRLLLTVPFAARWHYIPHDYWRFTPSGLERLLSAAGFERRRRLRPGQRADGRLLQGDGPHAAVAHAAAEGLPRRIAPQAVGLTSPILVLLGGIAVLSLRGQGGNDCLGYTAVAEKVSLCLRYLTLVCATEPTRFPTRSVAADLRGVVGGRRESGEKIGRELSSAG